MSVKAEVTVTTLHAYTQNLEANFIILELQAVKRFHTLWTQTEVWLIVQQLNCEK